MFDDEFTLLEYGKNVKKISSKNFVVNHNGHQYGKFFVYSKVEIWYKGDLVASTFGDDGKKRRFKYLYLSFIGFGCQKSYQKFYLCIIYKS